MNNSSEIKALINLVDDEDESIYFHIKDKLISYGTEIVPFLEEAWLKNDFGDAFQSRVEDIIHEIQFSDVTEGLRNWVNGGGKNLFTGILLLNKHHYPEVNIKNIKARIEDIVNFIKSNWNEKLSNRQKIVAINRALYAHFKFQGDNANYYSPLNSILSTVVERRKGNPLMLSILYIEIARQLELNIVGVNLPRHFVVGLKDKNHIEFYLSPFNNGSVMNLNDLEDYLNRLNLPFEEKYFEECSNIDIVKRVLLNLINSYIKNKDKDKHDEVNQLYQIVLEESSRIK